MEQPRYNMLERTRVETEYAHLYREVGLGLTTFSPLYQGVQEQVEFIAGFWKRTGKEKWDGIIEQVNKLEPIAQKLGIKQSTLALAWVLNNPNISSAITGASSPEQVYENVLAVGAVDKLTPEILEEIDDILENKPPAITPRF